MENASPVQNAIQFPHNIETWIKSALISEEDQDAACDNSIQSSSDVPVLRAEPQLVQRPLFRASPGEETNSTSMEGQNSRKTQRKREQKRDARRRARAREVGFERKLNLISQARARLVVKETVQLDAAQLPIARGGFQGKPKMSGTAGNAVWTLDRVRREGYTVFSWDGR